MNTFEIKLSVLSILGEAATKEKAEPLYEWLMEELELKGTDDNVTTLKTVQ
jgi:hypothetical protein